MLHSVPSRRYSRDMSLRDRLLPTRLRRYDSEALQEAAGLIRDGEPVAVPTETVYGLAADATNSAAVARIYAAKDRPTFNPLIVHVADHAMAQRLVAFSPMAMRLADAFWPGPLTMVLPRLPVCPVSDLASTGLTTLAVRLPSHRAMHALIAAAGVPLAAPSANRSGHISPTRAAHVMASLGGRIPYILDDGPAANGLESTIIRPETERIVLLRPGPITPAALSAAVGLPVERSGGGEGITAPGQLKSHYAPEKPIQLDCAAPEPDQFYIGFGPGVCHRNLSDSGDPVEAAANLFAALHEADASALPRIAVAPIPDEGLGLAINDRLARAAA